MKKAIQCHTKEESVFLLPNVVMCRMKSQSVVRRNNVHTPKKQRGAAAIEFAAVFPVFFMIFYAIITYGMIFVAQQSITLAAAEGARAALRVGSATNPAEIDANREENARRAATGTGSVAYWLMPRLAFVPSLAPCGYNSPANSSIRCYSVTVTYPYKQYPLVPLLLGPLMEVVIPTQLSSTAIIQID